MNRFSALAAAMAGASICWTTPANACATCGEPAPAPAPPPAITGGHGGNGGQGGAGTATALGVGNGGNSYARGGNVTVLSLPSLPNPLGTTGPSEEEFIWEKGHTRVSARCPVSVLQAGVVGGRAPYAGLESSWYVNGGLAITVPMGTIDCAALQRERSAEP